MGGPVRVRRMMTASPDGSRASFPALPPSGSVRAIAATEQALELSRWTKHEREFANRGWTNECNGVATDGRAWFFTSNQDPPLQVAVEGFPSVAGGVPLSREQLVVGQPGVFQTDEAGRVVRHHHIERSLAGHVGDLDLFAGRLYVALEQPTGLLVLDSDLNRLAYHRIHTPDGKTFAWCSIHPWNGLLYTCDWNGADRAYAFDPETAQRRDAADLNLGRTLKRVQGGAFSPTGQLFLASDDESRVELDPRSRRPVRVERGHPGIYAYSAATGSYLGHLPVQVHHGVPKFEEIEGMCFGPRTLGGSERLIHLVLLDMDPIATGDDIHLKSYGP